MAQRRQISRSPASPKPCLIPGPSKSGRPCKTPKLFCPGRRYRRVRKRPRWWRRPAGQKRQARLVMFAGLPCFDLAACAEINNSRQGVLTRRCKLDHTPGDTVRGLPINTPTAKHCPLDTGHGQCRSVPYVPASARRNVRSHACPSFDLQNRATSSLWRCVSVLAKTDFN
jgi:hypothetical protein